MTIRERVLASRLIEHIDGFNGYAEEIGLSGEVSKIKKKKNVNNPTDNKRKKGQ